MPVTLFESRIFFGHPKLISRSELTLCTTSKPVMYPVRNTTVESGNDCYHSVQNLLSSSLIFKHKKVKMFSAIIISYFLWGVKLGRLH